MNFEMEDILMTDTDLLIQNLRRENEALRAELERKQKEAVRGHITVSDRGRVQGVFDMGVLEYVYMTEPRKEQE